MLDGHCTYAETTNADAPPSLVIMRRRHFDAAMTLSRCRAACESAGECRGLSWAWTNGPHCQLWVEPAALDPPVPLCRPGFDLETHCTDPDTGDVCRSGDGSGLWEAPTGCVPCAAPLSETQLTCVSNATSAVLNLVERLDIELSLDFSAK